MRTPLLAILLAGLALPAAAEPFTLAVLPDTQIYSFITASNPARPAYFEIQTQWIVDNAAAKNIKFVSHVGDIVDNVTAGQVAAADRALDILDLQVDEVRHGGKLLAQVLGQRPDRGQRRAQLVRDDVDEVATHAHERELAPGHMPRRPGERRPVRGERRLGGHRLPPRRPRLGPGSDRASPGML